MDLVRIEPGLYFWAIAVFLTLFTLLRKFAWKPLLNALEERQEGIRKSLDDADTAKRELAEVQEKAEALIGQARIEADSILTEARADGRRLREETRQQARTEAQSIVGNARRQIQLERDRAVAQIREEAVDLSLAIASKLIRRNLTKADNEYLIDDALKQVESRRVQ